MLFFSSTAEGRKLENDIDAARALNYKRGISLYEFSRAHNRRSAELVQKYSSFVIERSGRVSVPLQLLIHPSQLSFS